MSYEGGGSDPVKIMQGMEDIEDELNEMLASWPKAEETMVRHGKLLKKLAARRRVELRDVEGTVPDKDAKVEQWLWLTFPTEMQECLEAEAIIEASKARYKLLHESLT